MHHKIILTEANLNDIDLSLNLDNLECLCRRCHNKETHGKYKITFDEQGDINPY